MTRVGENLNAYCVHDLRGGRGRSGKANKHAYPSRRRVSQEAVAAKLARIDKR